MRIVWDRARARDYLLPVIRGLLALGILTVFAYQLRLNAATAALLYLVAVLLNCLNSGLWVTVSVSMAAVVLLDYFFIPPLFTFAIANPEDVVALASLLTASLAVTRLAACAREQARLAIEERRNLQRLYTLAERLL